MDANPAQRRSRNEAVNGSRINKSLFENSRPSRVRARGLQETTEISMRCTPGALTGRVFKQALRKLTAALRRARQFNSF